MTNKKTSSKTFVISRDTKTGQFKTAKEAGRRPTTTQRESVPKKAGQGDKMSSSKNKSGRYIEEKHRVSGQSIETISRVSKNRSGTLKKLANR